MASPSESPPRQQNKQEAKEFLKQRLAEIATGNFYGPVVERITVAELADDFLRDYRINERKCLDDVVARWNLHLEPFFGAMKASEVTSDLVARYVDSRRLEKASNATVNREMAALKRMFRIGLQATPPKVNRVPKIPRLEENNIRKGFLEEGQFEKLVSYCPDLWFRAIVEVGKTYGWRIGELLQLRVRQVDLLAKVIRLDPGTTKNRDGREVSMTQNVYALLSECIFGKQPDITCSLGPMESLSGIFGTRGGKPVLRPEFPNCCSMICGVLLPGISEGLELRKG